MLLISVRITTKLVVNNEKCCTGVDDDPQLSCKFLPGGLITARVVNLALFVVHRAY